NGTRAELVDAAGQRADEAGQRGLPDGSHAVDKTCHRLLELGDVFRTPAGDLQPEVLGAGQLFAGLAQQRLRAQHVGRQHFGGRYQPIEVIGALDGLRLGADRGAYRDVIEHLAAHPVRDLRRAFDEAPDLQVDPSTQLLDAESAFDASFDDAFEQCADRPPERALRRMRLYVFDALNGVAHDLRPFLVAAQPSKQAALIQTPLLDEEGGKLVRRDRLEARDLRRARRQVGEEKISRRRALDAARLLHLLVLGEKLQRHRIRAADQLVQENAELAPGAVD